MWTRSRLKEAAKAALHRNYWKIVLVSVILVLFGCETGKFTFHESVFSSSTERNKEEWDESGETGKKGIVTVKKRADSDQTVVEVIGGGAFEGEDIEIGFLDGMFVGLLVIVTVFMVFLAVLAVILAVDIFLLNPFSVGGKRFMVKSVEDVAQVKEIAYGFDHSYKNIVKVMFQMDLRILLWTLLLVIPGIIKMYEYYMVPYILTENPDIEYREALRISREMMDGNKWKTFVLGLSFILWDILGAITLGIAEVFYVQPYRSLTYAALYCQLKNTFVMNRAGMPVNGYGGAGGQNVGQYGAYGQNGENGQQW